MARYCAWSTAPMHGPWQSFDVVEQAGARIVARDHAIAGEVREDPAHHVESPVDRPGARVPWPK